MTEKIPPREKPFYVSSVEFDKEIKEFYKTDKWTPFLINAVQNIAKGVAHRHNFIRYSWRDDMISNAISNMTHALVHKKYDITSKFSSFGYFTTISWNACLEVIRKEKKNKQTVKEYREAFYQDMINSDLDEEHKIYIKQNLDFIETEKKEEIEKKMYVKTKEEYAEEFKQSKANAIKRKKDKDLAEEKAKEEIVIEKITEDVQK